MTDQPTPRTGDCAVCDDGLITIDGRLTHIATYGDSMHDPQLVTDTPREASPGLTVDAPYFEPAGVRPARFCYLSDFHPSTAELVEDGALSDLGDRLMAEAVEHLAAQGLKTAPARPITLAIERTGDALERGEVRFLVEGHAVPTTTAPTRET